jgi:general secretion pathway protein M
MIDHHALLRYARHPIVAVCCYCGLLLILIFTTWAALADVYERRAELAAASDILAQIEGRSNVAGGTADLGASIPAGSPFLEGQTVTVAGAAILQRTAVAVRRFGGNVLSSQVELESAQSKDGTVRVMLSCDLEQAELQKLLYDLEAGMPFLFVDNLVVQAGQGFTGTEGGREGGRLRVLLGVSGQWQGAK